MSAGTWRRTRQAVQILALLLYVALFVYANAAKPKPLWADLYSRFDPLLMIAASLAGRVLLSGLILAGIVLLSALVFGRVWCGWLCPLGTLLEWLGPHRSRRKPPPDSWRKAKVLLLVAILAAALLGNQSLIILDPITILNRTMATSIWPALQYAVVQLEALLYQIPLLWGPLDVVHDWLVGPVFRDLQPVFTLAFLVALLFCGLVALNWWAPRFWCRYLCPLGGLLGLVSRFALLRRVVGDDCIECARCSQGCPTGTIDPGEHYRSDPAECIVCLDCLVDCPGGSASFRWQLSGWQPAGRQSYDPGRRQVLVAVGVSLAGVALAGVEPATVREPATMIRPPGSATVAFSARCARCAACIRACPTQGLQPSLFEGGLQNLLTPRLVPRLGYCSFGCNACGQVCPTGAIPELDLVVKQHTTIGLASVNRDRCLPWAYHTPCIVCEEACPVESKAIKLEEAVLANAQGESVILQRPQVDRTLCIGCGICEYQCPLGGESAIRVYAPAFLDGPEGNLAL